MHETAIKASSTLIKERKIAMIELPREMGSVCHTYDDNIKNFVKDYNLWQKQFGNGR